MNNEILTKLKELITFYKEKEDIEGMFLTTYFDKELKKVELFMISSSKNLSPICLENIFCSDNFQIVSTLLTKKDLLFRETNELVLLKLLNSVIIYDKEEKLKKIKKELEKATDNISLATMNNEITFFDEPEIRNKI